MYRPEVRLFDGNNSHQKCKGAKYPGSSILWETFHEPLEKKNAK